MSIAVAELPRTLLTGPSRRRLPVPPWIAPLEPQVALPNEIDKISQPPELTVVRAKRVDTLLARKGFLGSLSRFVERSAHPLKIVFLFEEASRRDEASQLARLFCLFSRPEDLEVGVGEESAATTLHEAMAKMAAARQQEGAARATADPLGALRRVMAATKDLREETGKLSAAKVATAFGLSVAELASILGRSRQAVSKTPAADALQEDLRAFERVARLRAILDSAEFRQWLHSESADLEGRTPLERIREGHVVVVADLVEDLLTGSPA
jgi:hypothetical protein